MMRKVTEIDEEWDFPYSIIESREDIIIIEQAEFYPAEIDENKVPIIPVGEAATWEDVHNLRYFDLRIGNYIYSWDKKEGHIHIGLSGDKIGLVKYRAAIVNFKQRGNTKKTVVPKLFGEPAVEIIDGYVGINGVSDGNLEYYDVSTKSYRKLNTIKRVAPDGGEYNLIFNPPIMEEDIYV